MLQETRMSDIGPAGRATVMVCITCRAATDLADAPGTAASGTAASGTDAPDSRSPATDSPGAATPNADASRPNAEAPRAGVALAEATVAAARSASDISVQRVRCLGNCSRGLSAAIRCDNAWTYVFGGLEPTRDGPSLIIGAQLLAQAADGIMPWRGRPESLKRGLIARVPPSNFREELP
jgi:predicted metal-binding protein